MQSRLNMVHIKRKQDVRSFIEEEPISLPCSRTSQMIFGLGGIHCFTFIKGEGCLMLIILMTSKFTDLISINRKTNC